MRSSTIWLVILILLATAGGYYVWRMEPEPLQQPIVEAPPQPSPEQPPVYPVPQTPGPQEPEKAREAAAVETPLPSLEDSDNALREEFDRLFAREDFSGLFIFKAFINRFVVTVDNLTAAKLPQKFRFTAEPPESFAAIESGQEQMLIDPANDNRYSAFVSFTEAIDTRAMAAVYVRYYPLFQQAYEDLGYPNRYFNDRMVQVIDHLLDAPEIKTPIALVRPNVFYQFADPELEALSAGQKLMVRIGNENAAKVKSKLRELRQVITTLPAIEEKV